MRPTYIDKRKAVDIYNSMDTQEAIGSYWTNLAKFGLLSP